MNNLISNAFKYTKVGGKIKVGVAIDGENLRISVYNTGKGISKADSEKIFNRYSVLDNVEENAIKGLSSRNGLGMAICHSMVELLKGSIEIQSEVGQYAEFIVTLPHCEVTEPTEPTSETTPAVIGATPFAKPDALPEPAASNDTDDKEYDDGEKPHILIIDDNAEILTLLRDSLSEYRITTASSADEGISAVMQCNPDLIITDVMMPGTDGMELTRQIKQNKHTMHIPVIILSAKNSTQEKIEGLESGADAYVGKPFNFSYLRAMIARLISSRTRLKEYYNTSASAYEYTGGKLLNKEDKDMMEKIIEFIDANIDDPDLSPEMLSKHMLTSVRNLYRKFKEIGELPPNDFIKAHRLAFAAKLLLTTKLMVQEIIYRAGFTNRSHFYKEFDKRYGMTPKEYRMQNTKADTSLKN